MATVQAHPVQTEYKVDDHFYVDGIKVGMPFIPIQKP